MRLLLSVVVALPFLIGSHARADKTAVAPAALTQPEQAKTTHPEPARRWFWVSLATTAALVTASTYVGLQVNGRLENDKVNAIRDLRNTSGIMLDPTNACADAASRGNVAASVVSACDRGKSWARTGNLLTWGALGAAVTSGYFFYRGFLRGGSSPDRSDATASKRVQVAPVVSPSGLGFVAAFRY